MPLFATKDDAVNDVLETLRVLNGGEVSLPTLSRMKQRDLEVLGLMLDDVYSERMKLKDTISRVKYPDTTGQ